MKECDKGNSHISSKLHMISLLIMIDTLFIHTHTHTHRNEYVSTPTSELADFHASWWEHCHICPLGTYLPAVSNRSMHGRSATSATCCWVLKLVTTDVQKVCSFCHGNVCV